MVAAGVLAIATGGEGATAARVSGLPRCADASVATAAAIANVKPEV
jgi:hypothetical protein